MLIALLLRLEAAVRETRATHRINRAAARNDIGQVLLLHDQQGIAHCRGESHTPTRSVGGNHHLVISRFARRQIRPIGAVNKSQIVNRNAVVGKTNAPAHQRVTAGVVGVIHCDVVGAGLKRIANAHGQRAYIRRCAIRVEIISRPVHSRLPLVGAGPTGGIFRILPRLSAQVHWQCVPANNHLWVARRHIGQAHVPAQEVRVRRHFYFEVLPPTRQWAGLLIDHAHGVVGTVKPYPCRIRDRRTGRRVGWGYRRHIIGAA